MFLRFFFKSIFWAHFEDEELYVAAKVLLFCAVSFSLCVNSCDVQQDLGEMKESTCRMKDI